MIIIGQGDWRWSYRISYMIIITHASFPGEAAIAGGASFMRWGKTTCPNTTGTELVYGGTMVGSAWDDAGTAECLCLHQQPQFLRTTPGLQVEHAKIHETEYQSVDNPPAFSSMLNHNALCSLCYTPTRAAKIIIPARTSCPPSWNREYYGYLMAEKFHVNQQEQSSSVYRPQC
jgi:hypothetical protein